MSAPEYTTIEDGDGNMFIVGPSANLSDARTQYQTIAKFDRTTRNRVQAMVDAANAGVRSEDVEHVDHMVKAAEAIVEIIKAPRAFESPGLSRGSERRIAELAAQITGRPTT